MQLRLSLFLAVVACVAGCAFFNPIAEALGGFTNAGILRHADKVEATLLRFSVGEDRRARYEEVGFVAVPPELAARMQAALLNEATYVRDRLMLCAPVYFARVRFHQGRKSLYVDFCFDCSILAVTRQGEMVGQRLFQKGVFLAALSQLFPVEALATKRPAVERAKPWSVEQAQPTRPSNQSAAK